MKKRKITFFRILNNLSEVMIRTKHNILYIDFRHGSNEHINHRFPYYISLNFFPKH